MTQPRTGKAAEEDAGARSALDAGGRRASSPGDGRAPGTGGRRGPDAGRASVWERIDRPAAPPRATLTHDQIAAAGIEIADAEGLDAVSMRKIAAKLGVAAMALYRYVDGKDELRELMVDAVHRSPSSSGRDGKKSGWRAVLRDLAHHTRARLLAHPWLGLALAQATSLTPDQLAGAERVLASLEGLGCDADTMMAVMESVMDYARGATAREAVVAEMAARTGGTPDDLRKALAPHMTYLMSTGQYPTFHRWVQEATHKDDVDWRFDFGLECLLDGIAARLLI
jgi:AcrR family transcriptional regulator